jgi:translocation and assembly module TamB
MFSRYLSLILFSLSLLLLTPVYGGMSFNADSSLDHFSYDLDNIHFELEKLHANWLLSPLNDNKLSINRLQAKRLTITINESKNNNSESSLPDRINLPFPIKITQAEINEVIIKSESDVQLFNNVKFSFEGDKKTLNLKSLKANTPWGEIDTTTSINTAKPFTLKGTVALKQANNSVPYDISARISGDLTMLHFNSVGLLVMADNILTIQQSNESTKQPVAHILTDGTIDLNNDYSISLNSNITEIRPERFGAYPQALLNLDLNLNGKLQTLPTSTIQFKFHDSRWQGQPLLGAGHLNIQDEEIKHLEFQASINTNKIQANGSIGNQDSQLEWLAELPDLNDLNKAYAGELHAKGSLKGAFDNLALNLNLVAEHLSLSNNLKFEHLNGGASIEAGIDRKVKADFKMSNIKYGQHTLASGLATVTGMRKDHLIVVTAEDKDLEFRTTLQGELSSNLSWQGSIQELIYNGVTSLKLTDPATLTIDHSGVQLKQAKLELLKGSVYIGSLQVNNNTFTSEGHIDQLSLKSIPPSLLPEGLEGDAIFSGKWAITTGNTVNGNLSFWKDSGDITLSSPEKGIKPLGLTEAKFDVAVTDNFINLTTNVTGKYLGSLNAKLTTAFSKTNAGFALLANAPFNLNANAQLETVSWLSLFTTLQDLEIDGQISLSAKANGSLSNPNLNGSASGKNLEFKIISQGVSLTKGMFDATFQNDALNINQASWQGGNGNLKTNGVLLINKGKPSIDLTWTAEKFTALLRTDRLLILSGSGKTTLTDGLLSIFGTFTADKGLIELAKDDTPVLGEDVIVMGDSILIKENAFQILLNGLRINLGDDFVLRGRGLDAQLTGGLTLTGLTQYHPHTEGSIQVKKGTYLAYGQTLNIERGILNFNGPMDNPGLNIRAMRNSKPVNAGIEITGSASQPLTKLVSDPEVSESEKLSWLVLGHGMAEAGKNDYGMLSLAAGVLLSQGQSIPLQTQLARAAGLDEFSFSGGDAESAALTFGKRLSSQLYLSYEKSISGLLDVARLTFNMTSRWSLIAEAGSESAVDVLYTFSFK